MATFYPQATLEGFGKALASKLGVNVQYAQGQPRTDGKIVWLPTIQGALTLPQFQALCGTAIHEAAHVYFESVPHHKAFVKGSKLRAQCFNAVIDVADETRIEKFVPSAPALLLEGNRQTAYDQIANKRFSKANNPTPLDILILGIFSARLKKGSFEFRRIQAWIRYWNAMSPEYSGKVRLAAKILARAKTSSADNKPDRKPAQWKRLADLAEELVALFGGPTGEDQGEGQNVSSDESESGQGSGQSGKGESGGEGESESEGPSYGQAAGEGGEATTHAAQNGSTPHPTYDVVGDEADGESLADDPSKPTPTGQAYAKSWFGSGNSGDGFGYKAPFNEGIYSALKPCLSGPIIKLAECQDADGYDGQYLSGKRFGKNLTNYATTGRIFQRREAEGERLHIAILLDSSVSMQHQLKDVAPVAQAFLEVVKTVADTVYASTFSTFNVPVTTYKDMSKYRLGGTNTDLAMIDAIRALEGCRGRRVIVIITDGQPNSVACTAAQAAIARQKRISVIGIAYQTGTDALVESLPGAEIVGANDIVELAARLHVVCTKIGAMAT